MYTPKYSIVVPVFNVEKYLDECVKSILAQTFSDFELLLIDDGSTDCSGEICDKYAAKDNRIRVFHKKNGGVSSARNLGTREANGLLITYLDSDDLLKSHFLEKIDFLEKSFPSINIFCVGHEQFGYDENGTKYLCGAGNVYMREIEKGDILVFDQIRYAVKKRRWSLGCVGSYIFRTSFIRDSRFSEKLDSGEDTKFHFEAALRGKTCVLNEILMSYRFDVPEENKVRVQRRKSLKTTWVYHLDEYNSLLKTRPEIKRYLDWLRLGAALAYRGNPMFRDDVREILSHVSKENWTPAFWILHRIPWRLQKLVFSIWRKYKLFKQS